MPSATARTMDELAREGAYAHAAYQLDHGMSDADILESLRRYYPAARTQSAQAIIRRAHQSRAAAQALSSLDADTPASPSAHTVVPGQVPRYSYRVELRFGRGRGRSPRVRTPVVDSDTPLSRTEILHRGILAVLHAIEVAQRSGRVDSDSIPAESTIRMRILHATRSDAD